METDLLPAHEPAGPPTRVVFLVHGTRLLFARRAQWVRAGSRFINGLLNGLGPSTLIKSFTWSGRNSVGAREEAARRLSEHLRESAARFPGVRHSVIGHSHGGSVALKAVTAADLADADVVCLSTPILCAVPRNVLTESHRFIYLLLSIPAAIVLAAFTIRHWPGVLMVAAIALVCFPVWMALAIFQARATQLAKTIEVPDHRADRVLFVRFVGDEASLALGVFQGLQYAMNFLIRAIVGVFALLLKGYDWVAARHGRLAAILYVPALFSAALYGYNGTNLWWLCIPIGVAILVALALLCLTPVLALLALVIGLASILVAIFPFGFRLATATMWVEVCVEALPRGRWNALILEPSARFAMRGLRHSFAYQEERAISAIIEHLNRKGAAEHRAAG
jgi:hypothetical protein